MEFKTKIISILIFSLLVITSCKDKIEEYYSNGKIQSLYYIKKNKIEGLVTHYFESGQISKKVFYEDGFPNGPEFKYYPTGNIEFIGNYENGVGSGFSMLYFETGSIQEILNFENGVVNGKRVKFYQNGRIKSKYEMYCDSIKYEIDYDESGTPFRIYRKVQIIGPDTINGNIPIQYKFAISGPPNKSLLSSFRIFPIGTKDKWRSKDIELNVDGTCIIKLSKEDLEIYEIQFIVLERLRGYEYIYHVENKAITYLK